MDNEKSILEWSSEEKAADQLRWYNKMIELNEKVILEMNEEE